MKKIVLSLTFVAFIISMSAQVEIKPLNKNFPKEPKSKEKLLPFIEPNTLQQKEYEIIGWLNPSGYLNFLMNETQKGQLVDSYSFLALLPDTCLKVYATDIFTPGAIGMGMTIDLYSPVFNENFTSGILPTPPATTYAYRLDSIQMFGLYYMGTKGYNPASPDTLRVFATTVAPYRDKRDHYIEVYMNGHQDTMYLIPKITVNGANQVKGLSMVPTSPNTIQIDYILQASDTVYTWDSAGTSWFRYSIIDIPLTYDGVTANGFDVPCGDALAVMVHFIPGYDYELGDTLYHGEVVAGEWADGYPIRISNQFSLRYQHLDDISNEFADPFGFNNPLLVSTEHRYQMFTGDAAFLNEYYYPAPNSLPTIYLRLSANNSDSCDIDVAIPEANDIVSKIYPNPTNDRLTIDLKSNETATIRLYNILGQEVKTAVSSDMQTTLNVSDLKAGLYVVKIEQKGKYFTSKVSIR